MYLHEGNDFRVFENTPENFTQQFMSEGTYTLVTTVGIDMGPPVQTQKNWFDYMMDWFVPKAHAQFFSDFKRVAITFDVELVEPEPTGAWKVPQN